MTARVDDLIIQSLKSTTIGATRSYGWPSDERTEGTAPMTDNSYLHQRIEIIQRDIRILTDEMRARTDAMAWGLYGLLAMQPTSRPRHLEFWSRWNAACARRDDEYPAPSGGAAE